MRRVFEWIRNPENWPTILIPLLLMAWARYGATNLALGSFESATEYAGPYRGPLPFGPSGDPVADRVVLVVVDGLRRDVSESMTFLNEMRAEGSDRTVVAGQPSLSFPGWTVIATGAWQEGSGFASNYVDRPVEIDSLFRAVGRAGGISRIVGSPGWDQLFGDHADGVDIIPVPEGGTPDIEQVVAYDREVLDTAMRVLADPPDFLLVHFPAVDEAGHDWGGASAEYRRAASEVDGLIRRLAGALDPTTTALFVTADHGHTGSGGHSGPEPEVVNVPFVGVGAGVRPGAYPEAAQADIAPTLAVLLGTSFPAHNQGEALFDQIDGPPHLLAARAVDNAEQVTVRYENMIEIAAGSVTPDRALLDRARQALADGRDAEATGLADEAIDAARGRWLAARAGRLGRERAGRFFVALAVLAPVVLYGIWWRRRRWNGWAPAFGAALYLLLWNVNYHVIQGLTYSSSWFNNDADIEPFLTARVIEALAVSALAVIVVSVLRRASPPGAIARDAAHTLLLIGVAQLVQVLGFYVLWGLSYTWYLPDFVQGFKYYLDVFQTTAAWPMTALPAAAILVAAAPPLAWLARTIEAGYHRLPAGDRPA